jgi:hypothetical protein
MADITKTLPNCDDGERGERGRRGKRGHRGPDGPSGGVTGDPNTLAYFGPDGRLTDDPDATLTLDEFRLLVPGDPTNAFSVNRVISSVASGVGSTAPGTSSSAEGLNTVASGPNSHAEGEATIASGLDSHAEGFGTTASGQSSHAEGQSTLASAAWAHAEGNGTTASANGSHAEGETTIASGGQAHAEGEGSIASGQMAHAEGMATIASNIASHAEGVFANASRWGQHAHSSGPGTTSAGNGGTQQSVITMAGETPGVSPNESVELSFGSDALVYFSLENGRGYMIEVTSIARGSVAGNPSVQIFQRLYAVRRDGGVSTIAASGTNVQLGDAALASSALTASIGTSPDRFSLTLFTGEGVTSAVRVTAKVEFVEIYNPSLAG